MFDKFGATRTKELMESLANKGKYQLSDSELSLLREDFDASFSDDSECEAVVGNYAKKGYIMDPHTATCMKAYDTLREKLLKTIVYSTAEWTKFSPSVAKALGQNMTEDTQALQWVSKNTNVTVPTMINGLFSKPIIHTVIVPKEGIQDEMLGFL